MEKLKDSIQGLISGAFAYLLGRNRDEDELDDSVYSEVDCQSDCSLCDSENRSISLPSSKSSRAPLSEFAKNDPYGMVDLPRLHSNANSNKKLKLTLNEDEKKDEEMVHLKHFNDKKLSKLVEELHIS